MFDKPAKNYLVTTPEPSRLGSWLPVVIVLAVVAGFVVLSWYAYHAGTQSVKDADLLVVEADKTPVKEKPVDAGGMQFPDQDKTIFDTFSNNNKQPPKVERVLPIPEEPVQPDTAGTAGWINEKKAADTQNSNASKPEQVITPDASKRPTGQDVVAEVKKPVAAEKPAAIVANNTPQQADNQVGSYVAPTAEKAAPEPKEKQAAPKEVKTPVAQNAVPANSEKEQTAVAAIATPPAKEKPVAAPKDKTPAVTPPADDKAIRVQLGAYRSEKEAQEQWVAIQKKHPGLLAEMKPAIIKADLGDKGIYYRLRAGDFASADEAKALCGKLSDAGQACIIPTSK